MMALQNRNSPVSTPYELGLAIFVMGMIFVFICSLYLAILFLGQIELRREKNGRE